MSSGTGGNYPAPVVAGESAGINSAFQPFPYPNTTQAANNAYSGIQNEVPAGAISGLTGGAQSLLHALPGLSQAGTGALRTGQAQYGQLAPYVTTALQAGFDPQHALYNQQFQQQQQQNLASQAMAGVGQSPYAAGLTAQGNNNFNIDWQNAQLGRQAQGAQTAEGLSSTAMNDYTSGFNSDLASLQGMISALGGASSAFGQIAGLNANQVAQYLAYLNASTNNANAATTGQINALNSGTGLYSATNAGNLASQQLLNQSLGGFGNLLGTSLGSNGAFGANGALGGLL